MDFSGKNNASAMRLPVKMYLLIFISASVILYQYHLSTTWMLAQTSRQVFGENDGNQSRRLGFLHRFQCANVLQQQEAALPPLYIVTPTYRRPEQLAEITRMAHTLMHVPNVRWLVIEDAEQKTPAVATFLRATGMQYEHLTAPMPEQYKKKKKGPKPRGVSNRNRGLEWLRANAVDGVFYFADDDNTYDLELFKEIRFTKKVSMWPVGLITKLGISTPVVRNGSFAGFYDGWIGGRKFPVDMAGFAVSVKFLLERPKAMMPYKPGFEEDGFLKSLAPFEPEDIELLADKCTKILVWHTQTKKNEPSPPLNMTAYNGTNLVLLKQIIV